MIEIKKISSKKELKDFVKFPFSLYKDCPYWVPPIIKDELETLDPKKNPAFLDAEAHFFLAYKNNKIVGRIAGIINWQEVNTQKKPKVRFGWFDVIDDIEVTKKLLEKVQELGKKHHLTYMEGPMGFSNLDKVGVQTDGFSHIGTMITWYHHPYHAKHLKELGMVAEKKYLENKFLFSNVNTAMFEKAGTLIEKRYNLKALDFTSTQDIMPYVDKMFDLFNNTYSSLSSFVAISEIQKTYFKKKYISFINPEYIKYVEDENQNLVAFAIVMPSFSKALQKAKGKLFPFGFMHLLKAKKESKDVIFYLIGVHPEYQNKGVTAILFRQYAKVFKEKGIVNCIRTPELEDNTAIQKLWKNFDPKTHIKRQTFRQEIQ